MLTPAQQERLQTLHAYEWVENDPTVTERNLNAIFNAMETAEELWYASFIVAWDSVDGSLDRILNHELCDRGIALFLYWSLNPIAFHASGDSTNDSSGQVITKIEEAFKDGRFDTERVTYSPRESQNFSDDHAGVPDQMLAPSSGILVEFDYRTAVFP